MQAGPKLAQRSHNPKVAGVSTLALETNEVDDGTVVEVGVGDVLLKAFTAGKT